MTTEAAAPAASRRTPSPPQGTCGRGAAARCSSCSSRAGAHATRGSTARRARGWKDDRGRTVAARAAEVSPPRTARASVTRAAMGSPRTAASTAGGEDGQFRVVPPVGAATTDARGAPCQFADAKSLRNVKAREASARGEERRMRGAGRGCAEPKRCEWDLSGRGLAPWPWLCVR